MAKRSFLSLLVVTLLFISCHTSGQKQAKAVCVAFYNLENLYDTINDPIINDEEFTPAGTNAWTGDKYRRKIEHMGTVISQIGDEFMKGGPTMIGLSEIENHEVLEDLIHADALKNAGYDIVQFDSPDRRGVDVALLYKTRDFTLVNAIPVPMHMPGQPDFRTRDQLVVTGLVDNDTLTIVVNHWPSRGNDVPYRLAAARTTRSIVDSIYRQNKDARIMVMGDLNDDPVDESVISVLGANGRMEKVKPNGLFNPMWKMFKDGIGSLAYKDSWNLFDQIILSEPLIREKNNSWKLYKARVFSKPFMLQTDGQFTGYPFRTFAGGAYTGGYSDHLPVFVILVKEK